MAIQSTSQTNSYHHPRVAIIGAGPAGLTAAIYTARANLDTTVFTGTQPGGQLTTTTEIENFPGFEHGIMGPDLMENMQKQAQRFGATIEFSTVKEIQADTSGSRPVFSLYLDSGKNQPFDAVIVASGASARYLGLPGEEKLVGKGYHTCATCDGFFYRDKIIAVVGGGDSAMEEANFLTKFASKVYLIHRRAQFRASKIMQQKVLQNPKIEIIYNTEITSLNPGEKNLESIDLLNNQTQEKTNLKVDGVFVAIGHIPNTDFALKILQADEFGYLLNQEHLPPEARTSRFPTASSIEGIFVAGDVQDKVYRQAITAAGDGCRAALDCEKWLEQNT
jgi:thioredoxin reductase (NADPH)